MLRQTPRSTTMPPAQRSRWVGIRVNKGDNSVRLVCERRLEKRIRSAQVNVGQRPLHPLRAPLPERAIILIQPVLTARSIAGLQNGNLQEVLGANAYSSTWIRATYTYLARSADIAAVPESSCSVCWEILMACSGARGEKIKKRRAQPLMMAL